MHIWLPGAEAFRCWLPSNTKQRHSQSSLLLALLHWGEDPTHCSRGVDHRCCALPQTGGNTWPRKPESKACLSLGQARAQVCRLGYKEMDTGCTSGWDTMPCKNSFILLCVFIFSTISISTYDYKYRYVSIYDKTKNNTQSHPSFHSGRGSEKFPLSSKCDVKQHL